MLADILKQNKVNNSGMRFDPTARTALAFVTLKADGEREFLFFRHPSADMLLRESELDVNLIKQVCFSCFGFHRYVSKFPLLVLIWLLLCVLSRQGFSAMVQLV